MSTLDIVDARPGAPGHPGDRGEEAPPWAIVLAGGRVNGSGR